MEHAQAPTPQFVIGTQHSKQPSKAVTCVMLHSYMCKQAHMQDSSCPKRKETHLDAPVAGCKVLLHGSCSRVSLSSPGTRCSNLLLHLPAVPVSLSGLSLPGLLVCLEVLHGCLGTLNDLQQLSLGEVAAAAASATPGRCPAASAALACRVAACGGVCARAAAAA